jgi:threonine/homoserine efflux transporter RhtA
VLPCPAWLVAVRMAAGGLILLAVFRPVLAARARGQMLFRQVRLTPLRIIAVVAAAAGVWLLAADGPGGLHASHSDEIGIAFALASAVAFSFSLASLRHITPTEFAVTSTLEPAIAAVAAAVFLGVTLRPPQYAGGVLTVIAVLLLAPTHNLIRASRLPGPTTQPGECGSDPHRTGWLPHPSGHRACQG